MMIRFTTWLESKQFKRLIPDEVLVMIPRLKEKAQELTTAYFEDKTKVPSFVSFAKVNDPFFPGKKIHIGFITIEEAGRRGYPNAQGIASAKPLPKEGERIVYYRIPMTGFDTIYHELVHAFDPKLAKGISKIEKVNGFQSMVTPHEVDAVISGFVDIMHDKLQEASPTERRSLIEELKAWLRKGDADVEPWNMPTLLQGMQVYQLKSTPKLWRKLTSTIYNSLSQYDTARNN
jgi:hypothetical protein